MNCVQTIFHQVIQRGKGYSGLIPKEPESDCLECDCINV